ncbi:hypothetical protein PILCRDRAFT_830024 [Piloderma croceum F 1598]|uniref:Uncharacterized protein n=1 Tax=Piloderma croceum (strain F 1598) TaxID=765440 RepID=A0A0C3EVX8_PILCF|nr:hypothetical protein PILCRDRAFT_830024 [Piloderma croceum F 1598]
MSPEFVNLADNIIKTMLMVFPPLIVVVKQHTVDGRAKKAQELVDKSRALMKEHWRKMSKEQREELRSQLDIVTDLQSRLDGQRQVPQSLDPKNISNSRILKEAANVLWNVAVTTSNRVKNIEFDPDVDDLEEATIANLEVNTSVSKATGGLPAGNTFWLLGVSMDSPGEPIPPNIYGIQASTPIDFSNLNSKSQKLTNKDYREIAENTAKVVTTASRRFSA